MMTDWPEWPAARLADLPDPGARGFLAGDGDWPFRGFVVRRAGAVHAYANICPHRGHPLDMPPDDFLVDEGRLICCASHGALFEPETGLCLMGPCAGARLLKLECRVNDGLVLVRAPGSLQEAWEILGTN
jgi:nitrite reductase/ring-hydroxylating ferredoxin subunit